MDRMVTNMKIDMNVKNIQIMKFKDEIFKMTKFSYKIDCNRKLQPYSISFYWR